MDDFCLCEFFATEAAFLGILVLVIGPEPNKEWGAAPEAAPHRTKTKA